MTDQELVDKLAKFSYTKLWLDYGILTVDYLVKQEQIFDNSEDKNTEHYRYGTFRYYLDSKSSLSDIEVTNYLQLIYIDNDPIMAQSALKDIFDKINLTDHQFQEISKAFDNLGEWTGKTIKRQSLLRSLRSKDLTEDLFNLCILSGDSVVHEQLLDTMDLNYLRVIAINGKTNRIRKLAANKLNALTKKKGNYR